VKLASSNGTQILTISPFEVLTLHTDLVEFDFQNGWLSLILEERMHLTHEVPSCKVTATYLERFLLIL
jgi:hypothetical protein